MYGEFPADRQKGKGDGEQYPRILSQRPKPTGAPTPQSPNNVNKRRGLLLTPTPPRNKLAGPRVVVMIIKHVEKRTNTKGDNKHGSLYSLDDRCSLRVQPFGVTGM
ncbi:hypothetical protein TESG_08144 [Trichophyton tonsurans CBS 112818]|uniref:Uncharacterized protein n=1 Tax=Trichophyton tonsurans (strain CBS 112818) TaxID=647933 RepID=F2SB89_TRIT1|nr:hypothetical protein TESG_08144 [Trichophyton tonsurans CBS 112818]